MSVSARELWEEYRSTCCVEVETSNELGLQRIAFCCGVTAALGALAGGARPDDLYDGIMELMDEGPDVVLEADRCRDTPSAN